MHASSLGGMTTLQVRGVPEELSRVLKHRAAAAGMSLSEYVLQELKRLARTPTLAEVEDRIRLRGAHEPDVSAADILAAERDR